VFSRRHKKAILARLSSAAFAQWKNRNSAMKAVSKLLSAAALVISPLALAACKSNGASPSTYTIGGTVVNLAGTRGGLILQDNLKDTLSVNANGTFTFANPVANGSPYSVTISAQPSNPAQTCGVTNGSGIATANVTNIEVNCGTTNGRG
jgi:hypothetical protein